MPRPQIPVLMDDELSSDSDSDVEPETQTCECHVYRYDYKDVPLSYFMWILL